MTWEKWDESGTKMRRKWDDRTPFLSSTPSSTIPHPSSVHHLPPVDNHRPKL